MSNHDPDSDAAVLAEYLTPIRCFLDAEEWDEVSINRPGEVWTDGPTGWVEHPVPALTAQHCTMLAKLIASFNKKPISVEKPVLSGSLPNGERIQVLIPPACEPGTVSFTIRKPSMREKDLEELDSEGAFAECEPSSTDLKPFEYELKAMRDERRIKEFLHLAVQKKRTILIVGKTGSGKTYVSKALIRSIPAEERLITIEDVHELFLKHHRNRVHLFFARDDEGGVKVLAKQALASCLRMKPDRILLAELRGDEAWEFVKNVGTGHPGSMSTMHANGAFEAFEQLAALIKDSKTGAHLDIEYIKHRLFATIDIVLFYDKRKLREIYYDPERKQQHLG